MDKNKVKELICKAKNVIYCAGDNTLLDYEKTKILSKVNKFLDDAVKELSKSDWVSVEDDLPPYGESVLTTNEDNPDVVIKTSRRKCEGCNIDKNGFLDYFEVTHWKPIEKLEV